MSAIWWIDFIAQETESALITFYTYLAFQHALKDAETVRLVNLHVDFWRAYEGALVRTVFLYLGRLADGTNGKSFADFRKYCIENCDEFSRDAFLYRKREMLESNPSYLDDAVFPSESDIKKLFKIMRDYNDFLHKDCMHIRSRVFAHAILIEDHEREPLFEGVTFDRVEQVLLVMWSVSQHLWQAYHNARRIEPFVLQYKDKETILSATKAVIHGAA